MPAEQIFAFLESKGFTKAKVGEFSYREVVYRRMHERDSRYSVLVYTSVAAGVCQARALGEDAIRVIPFLDDGKERRHGLRKAVRVYRTGTVEGVLSRMLERMREAYAECNRARRTK